MPTQQLFHIGSGVCVAIKMNGKSQLNNFLQHYGMKMPIYETKNCGSAHEPLWIARATLCNQIFNTQQGFSTKKAAEHNLSNTMMQFLLQQNGSSPGVRSFYQRIQRLPKVKTFDDNFDCDSFANNALLSDSDQTNASGQFDQNEMLDGASFTHMSNDLQKTQSYTVTHNTLVSHVYVDSDQHTLVSHVYVDADQVSDINVDVCRAFPNTQFRFYFAYGKILPPRVEECRELQNTVFCETTESRPSLADAMIVVDIAQSTSMTYGIVFSSDKLLHNMETLFPNNIKCVGWMDQFQRQMTVMGTPGNIYCVRNNETLPLPPNNEASSHTKKNHCKN